jgi:large subunit ribosomal protein L18
MLAREASRRRRHTRLRKRVAGLPDRPRLAVYRSSKHLYAQVINDVENKTLFTCSTQAEAVKKQVNGKGGTISAAQQVGKAVAAEAIKRGIQQVVFDRGGYQYHGRVKALADAAREAGLQF